MLVNGHGPLNALIMIVGEAPGQEEERRGLPFVGSSGRLLDEMLSRNMINREECYITNIMPVRPPKNSFTYFYKDPKRTTPTNGLINGIQTLFSDIKRINPRVILALGAEPLRALTGKRGIEKWRGSILTTTPYNNTPSDDGLGKRVIATFHPANILRQYTNRTIAEIDLRRVREESYKETLKLPARKMIIRPSYTQVMEYLSNVQKGDKVAFDIETTGKRVRCLGLSKDPGEAICIPFQTLSHHNIHPDPSGKTLLSTAQMGDTNGNYFSHDHEYSILEKLYDLFRDPDVLKTAQNYPFDSSVLAHEFGFVIRGLFMDTMIAQHTLYPELPKSLDFLCSVYTRTPSYSTHNAADDVQEWIYNCMDACITRECCDKLETELHEASLWTFYKTHCEPAMIAYTRAQNRGIPTDETERARLLERETKKLNTAKEQVTKTVGFDLNPCSPKQVQEWLYVKKGVPVHRNRKTNKPSCGEKILLSIRSKIPALAPAINQILDYRSAKKMIGTFLEKELIDGKTYTTYNVVGTVTGRLSSSQNIWKEGVNITQTPKSNMRRMFIAPSGYVWIHSDLSQAEARFVFWDAGVYRIIERYMDDPLFDIHTWNASENIFKIPENEVTPEQRQLSKVGVHGGNYALGIKTASETFNISYQQAKEAIYGYQNGIPEIKQWWDRIEAEVTSTRTLHTPMGRRRQFLGRLDNNTFRSAYAYRPQSTVGDLVHRAFTYCDIHLPKNSFPLVPVHDEINILSPEKDVEQCVEVLKKAYHHPLTFEGVKYPLNIPVEISTGPNWWDQEKVKT